VKTEPRKKPGLSRQRNRMWAPPVLVRYVLMQLPVIALLLVVLIVSRESEKIPTWPVAILLVGWAIKDIAMYPSVWRSYDPEQQKAKDLLVGAIGFAKTDLEPKGMVILGSELWRAEVADNQTVIKEGDAIEVVRTRGLLLIVKPREHT
jgi:membrane-bound ClpP family serine protease